MLVGGGWLEIFRVTLWTIYLFQPMFPRILDSVNLTISWMNYNTLLYKMHKIILGGDFNAKANLGGSQRTDDKGLLLTRWAAERDLRITNDSNNSTCFRP